MGQLSENVKNELQGLGTADEILEYVRNLEEFAIELLRQRGMTEGELRARRKEIISSELEEIAAEKAKLNQGGTNPPPSGE